MTPVEIKEVARIIDEDIPCDRLGAGALIRQNKLLRKFIASYMGRELGND